MAYFRWSQTSNYGRVPNPKLPNTFLASGFDLGDPWAEGASYDQNCSRPNKATGRYGAACLPWDTSRWNPAVLPLAGAIRNDSTPFYMGAQKKLP